MSNDLGIKFPRADQCTFRAHPLPPLPAHMENLVIAAATQSRTQPKKTFAIDSEGARMRFSDVTLYSAGLAGPIQRVVGTHRNVGILMPPNSNTALANMATIMSSNVVVNLNYALGGQILDGVVHDAGISHVLTSRKVVQSDKFAAIKEALHCECVYLEDIRGDVNLIDQGRAWLASKLLPCGRGSRLLRLADVHLDDPAALMYTSGSTGVPKGAVLTHRNILSNIWQIKHHVGLRGDEVVLGVLPFGHCFGFTITLWGVLALGLTGVYHPNPMDGRMIGKLIDEHGVTTLASTPSLLRAILPRLTPEQCHSVEMLLLGAQKLTPELVHDIIEKLHIAPVEGYGLTEASPVVAANVHHKVLGPDGEPIEGNEIGSAGLVVPGTEVAVMDVDTGELLPTNKDGLIFVRGPQIFQGYWGQPEKTAAVLNADGWYYTGDYGRVSDEGRIYLGDRADNVIKMSGEMVAPTRIASAICQVAGVTEESLICVGVADRVKGQRPAVLYVSLGGKSPAEVCALLPATGLPGLWVPKANDFFQIDQKEMPFNGMKIDLKKARAMAAERAAS